MTVRLLLFPIPSDAETYQLAHRLLSPAEQARCARLIAPRARCSHAIGRAIVRLSCAGGGVPAAQDWPIVEEAGGKPYCPLPGAPRFNLSHTGDGDAGAYGFLAVAAKPVGVDLEVARPIAELPGMAAMVLSETERASLVAAPVAHRSRLFLRLWTLKEAVLKAAGTGFRGDPRAIDFGAAPAAPLSNAVVHTLDGRVWFTSEIAIPAPLLAALASSCPGAPDLRALTTPQLRSWLATGCAP
jgi:phosphopantetheine--protein transferase-like protein